MTTLCVEDDQEQIPTCPINGQSLEKVIRWTQCRNYFKEMDLKETFDTIISADFLANEELLDEMLKKVYIKNSQKVINQTANEFEDGTIVCLLDDFKRRNEVIVILHHDTLKYFDPQKSQWITITKIPQKFLPKKVCSLKDRIYVIGVDSDELAHLLEYNTLTKSWRTLPSASFGPYREMDDNSDTSFYFPIAFLCSVGNKLYTKNSHYDYEMEDGSTFFQVLDLDDEDPHWKLLRDVAYEDYPLATITVVDDVIYLVQYELIQTEYQEVIDKYDTATNEWTNVTNFEFSTVRGVAMFEGKIYISDIRGSLKSFDISTNTWTTLSSMSHKRSYHSLIVLNGSIVAVGGNVGSIEEYNVVDDTWTVKEETLDEISEGGFIMMKFYFDSE